MARSSIKTEPAQVTLGDGSFFTCACGSSEFRTTSDPQHWFCRCGRVYTPRDVFPKEES